MWHDTVTFQFAGYSECVWSSKHSLFLAGELRQSLMRRQWTWSVSEPLSGN
jgi:hypothetical protein